MDKEIGKNPGKTITVGFIDRNTYPPYSSVRLLGLS